MRKIMVEPEQLEACAVRMESANQEYRLDTNQLFAAVDNMSEVWQGKDNLEFTSSISMYESECTQMAMLCDQYSDFLKNSARAYRETQDSITAQAARLIK